MDSAQYTVLEENTVLGTSHFRGSFATIVDAETFATEQASRSRSFVRFRIYQRKNGKLEVSSYPRVIVGVHQ